MGLHPLHGVGESNPNKANQYIATVPILKPYFCNISNKPRFTTKKSFIIDTFLQGVFYGLAPLCPSSVFQRTRPNLQHLTTSPLVCAAKLRPFFQLATLFFKKNALFFQKKLQNAENQLFNDENLE